LNAGSRNKLKGWEALDRQPPGLIQTESGVSLGPGAIGRGRLAQLDYLAPMLPLLVRPLRSLRSPCSSMHAAIRTDPSKPPQPSFGPTRKQPSHPPMPSAAIEARRDDSRTTAVIGLARRPCLAMYSAPLPCALSLINRPTRCWVSVRGTFLRAMPWMDLPLSRGSRCAFPPGGQRSRSSGQSVAPSHLLV
jgi:hypothetical protein